MKIVTHITWNWSPATMEGNANRMDTYSDTCEMANVDDENVERIEEHPTGQGNIYFYDIIFTNGEILRILNPNTVNFKQT